MLRAARRSAEVASGQRTFAALPALSTEARSGGFFSKLFIGGGSRVTTPLTEPLEGGLTPPLESPLESAPETQSSTLSNGVTIAAEATPGPTASIGVYVNTGSVHETEYNAGISHLLENLAFKSTQHRTHFRLVREIEGIGAHVAASASREQMVYAIDTSKASIPEALEILGDAVLNPKFLAWEVSAAAQQLESQLADLSKAPASLLLEGLHSVAYEGALGRPLIALPGSLANISSDDLAKFVEEHYRGGNMVLSGGGMEHAELVELAKPLFDGVPAGKTEQPQSRYTGGDYRTPGNVPTSDVLLAFEVPGGWRDMKTSITATVLQFLLGGGGSFSSGGPGKGMLSRLYKRVLNRHGWVTNATAFSTLYNDTGIAGIHITADSHQIDRGVDIAISEMEALTKNIPEEEVQRAKNAALSTVLSSLESRNVVSEDIGRQILTFGSRKPIADFIKTVEELTSADLSKLVTRMLQTPPAFAGHGNIAGMPRYDALFKRFS